MPRYATMKPCIWKNSAHGFWEMLSWIALGCLIGAVALLALLSVVDLRRRILPNEMVVGFGTLGIVFHLTTLAQFLTVEEVFLGGIIGFLALYLIRYIANRTYGQDALGLGDVKLMGAGGVWLGPDTVMFAMAAGAMAALLHGLFFAVLQARRTGNSPDFLNLQIPAGPGFAVGIIIGGIIQFWSFRVAMP